jgi:glycosyltransferase involved in cell wall biosynthesis
MTTKPNIAIVHDWLYGGGAEKVVEQLHVMYPDAPIYTSYCTDEWRERLHGKVVTGYLQNWPFSKLRKFLPLIRQWWFAGLDLGQYDVIICTTGNGEAKFIKPPEDATYVCYCHSPPHFYYRKYDQYMKNPGFGAFDWLARIGLKLLVKPLRSRDYAAAQRPDFFIGNSTHIASDIKLFYNREAVAIFPPVDVKRFIPAAKVKRPKTEKPTFIYWGRHVPDKHIDLAILACNELGLELTVIGNGPDTPRLKKLAGPTITFTGRISDEEMVKLAGKAHGFIFPSHEDFGIAPVEALAAGLPLIAYKAGGALDYVIDGKTGTFFDHQTAESVVKALKNYKYSYYKTADLVAMAQNFTDETFRKNMQNFMNDVLAKAK